MNQQKFKNRWKKNFVMLLPRDNNKEEIDSLRSVGLNCAQ